MGRVTGIGWTDATFNSWWGCTKVGPPCDHCYAEAFDRRVGGDHWGVGKPRRYFGEKHWNEPRKWNEWARRRGVRMKVFCASMADVFDNEVEQHWREKLWALIRETPWIDWQIVTKRIGNAPKMLPRDWGDWGYQNVWLIITVGNQQEADRDIDKLLDIPARVHGLSVEPMLGKIDLRQRWVEILDWAIIGGESGPHARDFDMDAARVLTNQCLDAGVAVFVKQMGSRPVYQGNVVKFKHPKGERPEEWPADLRVRQFPKVAA